MDFDRLPVKLARGYEAERSFSASLPRWLETDRTVSYSELDGLLEQFFALVEAAVRLPPRFGEKGRFQDCAGFRGTHRQARCSSLEARSDSRHGYSPRIGGRIRPAVGCLTDSDSENRCYDISRPMAHSASVIVVRKKEPPSWFEPIRAKSCQTSPISTHRP
jgi:hypothetical protein